MSACLEAEVTKRIASQGIVVWLDKDGHYSAFVDELEQRHAAGDFPYPVLGYRGSFLALMLALESHGNGLDPEPLLIHLPGYGTSASLLGTPLLELYKAGTQFIKALPTLVTEAAAGRVTPAELATFLEAEGLSLAIADAWLAEDRSHRQTGFAVQLEARGLPGVIDSLFEQEKKNQALRLAIPPNAAEDLAAYFLRHTGMDDAWLMHTRGRTTGLRVEEVGDAWASYLLSVEYVADLSREPRSAPLRRLLELPKPLRERCLELVKHFRTQHPEAYAGMADDTERHLGADKAEAKPEDLGKIDTFRFEEEKMREAAILAAQEGRWSQALTWAKQRSGVAFWLDRDMRLRWEWTLLEHAAKVGVAIERVGPPPGENKNLAEALEDYSQRAYEVDTAHRHFEQRVYATPQLSLLKRNEMLAVFDRVRAAYRSWADNLGRSFTQICRRYGALPDESLQQRTIFERVVAPLAEEIEKVVLFMIDAFRFEMAKDLEAEMKGAGITVELSARLAELPTITSVGMNVLAPVTSGEKVFPVFVKEDKLDGFRCGEFTVNSPESRARAIGQKVSGQAVPLWKLADVRTMSTTSLQKKVKEAPRVIVVHSLEFDDAGEKGFGPATFETTLQHIREAWLHLSQAGVKSFVFTGDHGFLLQDSTVTEHQYGRASDPDRRYVLEDYDRTEAGMFTVPLSKLGYGVTKEKYLLFREDTGVWKTTKPGAPFVHGGNSLQERVIPVLVVRRQRERGGSDTVFEIQAEALEDNLGRRRLKLKLRLAPNATGALAFTGSSQVTLGLRVKDRPDITVTIVDVEGTAVVQGGLLRVPTKDEWSTVYFQLDGHAEERVQVEVFHPDGVEKVTPHVVAGWFDVTSKGPRASTPAPAPETKAKANTENVVVGIDDEGFRRVFEHLERFGSVNEIELVQILGSARKMRTFSREFEELVKRVKFRVRIDTAGNMKCYVKEAG
ncbi:MAG TPA: BREX-6 system phosphatase PglZ [Labilithrix sp.]|nr:BREX-6 system phosphatase PglZ [Labilithrix sp.]